MNSQNIYIILISMAITMIALRAIPLLFFKKKIENKFLKSFFTYIPSTVLTALIVPEVFSSTSTPVSAWAGVIMAVVLSYFGRGLFTVSACAVITSFITEVIMRSMGILN
ncbi:MAG: AzlD domain-containing protein [Clostridia bacterium]|nr:AzlD domain-containing protein [Clostridia bacterium]